MLYTGIFTPKSYVLFENKPSIKNIISKLKKDNVIEKAKNYKVFECINLKEFKDIFEKYLDDNIYPAEIEWFLECGKNIIWAAKYKKKSDSNRVLENSEVATFMYVAGIKTIPTDKYAIITERTFIDNAYYTSREIKEYSSYKVKEEGESDIEYATISSRLNGLLISRGGNYNVYHLGDNIKTWYTVGESKIKNYEERLLSRYEFESKTNLIENGLLITYNLSTLNKLFNPTKKMGLSWNSLEHVYKNIYAIPFSIDGKKLLKLMVESNWREYIYEIIMEEKRKDTSRYEIDCDHYDGKVYTFLFCIPDIGRYLNFVKAAKFARKPENYRVICFDFQLEFIRESSAGYAKIQSLKIDDLVNVWNEEVNPR